MSADIPFDRQQARTREAIVSAFTGMLFDVPYSSLTVAGLCDRANVGRSTFYEHFRTKNDVLRAAVAVPFSALAAAVSPETSVEALLPWLHHFRDNHTLGRVLFVEPVRSVLLRGLAEQIVVRLTGEHTLPTGLLAAQIAASQFALVEPWMLGQVALAPEALALALCRSSWAVADAARTTKGTQPGG